MSERSGGPDAPPGPAPTDGTEDDIYAAAAASTVGRSRSESSRRPTVRSQGPVQTDNGSGPAPDGAAGTTSADPATGTSADPVEDRFGAAGGPTSAASGSEVGSADAGTQVIATEAPAEAADEAGSEKRKVGAARGTRRARLRLSRVDPWSVMKTAFMFSIAAGIVLVVAVYAIWLVIGSSGLFESINSIVGSVLQSPSDSTPFRVGDYINTQKVMGVTAFLACVDVVIFTALATLASFLYNLAAVMLGGLEVTLAED